MIWVDYAILAIIGLSALISIWRGLIREVLSLLAWILAILVAVTFMRPLADLLTPFISVPSARLIIAFVALFIATLLCGAIINLIIAKLVMSSGLSGTDRVLGIVFGVARGALVVGVLVLIARLTPLPQDPWWEQSVLLGRFEAMALWMRSYLPRAAILRFSRSIRRIVGDWEALYNSTPRGAGRAEIVSIGIVVRRGDSLCAESSES